MDSYFLSHLDALEAEAIHVMREVAAEFERPVLLFSGGKDSICLLRLAEKAFRPAHFPFPLLHIDTGHNFPEVIEFRDRRVRELGERLIVRTVDDAIEAGIVTEPGGTDKSRNWLQIPTLLHALEEFKFDAAFGGARRDEEKSRAKERFFSFRDEFGQWDPRNQRPELWSVYNTRIRAAHPGLPPVQLDRTGCLAIHRQGGAGDPEHLLQPSAAGLPAGRIVDERLRPASTQARRGDRDPVDSIQDGWGHPLHGRH